MMLGLNVLTWEERLEEVDDRKQAKYQKPVEECQQLGMEDAVPVGGSRL